VAIDLGAGNGIQSIALKNLGFQVTAVDFNKQLLEELKSNPSAEGIAIKLEDITNVKAFAKLNPELIACCGDTPTHLESKEQVEQLLIDSTQILVDNGNIMLSFRDYTYELKDEQRFIPVKSSSDRILTCVLEYEDEKVRVTDLLHENFNGEWTQKASGYYKLRLAPVAVIEILEESGMKIHFNESIKGVCTIIGQKSH